MFLGILRRDLTRKKTMNVILLLFIILATLFVSASMNNVLTVTGALEQYFAKTNMSDFVAVTKSAGSEEAEIRGILDEVPAIDSLGVEELLYLTEDQVRGADDVNLDLNGAAALFAIDDAYLSYFDGWDLPITDMDPGEVYVYTATLDDNDLVVGDTIVFEAGDSKVELRIAGTYRDVMFGSSRGGMTRILLSEKDFETLQRDPGVAGNGGFS